MATVRGVEDLGIFRIIGQPNLNYSVDRDAAARWGINVADIQDAIQTAVGANALTQVQQGEARYDVTLRYEKPYRDTREAIDNIRLLAPTGERVSLSQLTKVSTDDGAEEIYREGGQRYIAIKYSVRGRDLGSTVRRGHRQGQSQRASCLPAITSNGPANTRARSAPTSAWPSSFRSPSWHLPDSLHDVPLLQVGHADFGLGHDGVHRRPIRAVPHAHQLLRVFGGWLSRAFRGLRADRRHHA